MARQPLYQLVSLSPAYQLFVRQDGKLEDLNPSLAPYIEYHQIQELIILPPGTLQLQKAQATLTGSGRYFKVSLNGEPSAIGIFERLAIEEVVPC